MFILSYGIYYNYQYNVFRLKTKKIYKLSKQKHHLKMAKNTDNKIKMSLCILFWTHCVTTHTISQDHSKSEVFANISQAFWVDNVAYSLTEAEHIVCLYYKSATEKHGETIHSIQLTTSEDNTSHQNTSQLVRKCFLKVGPNQSFILINSCLHQVLNLGPLGP